MRPTIETFTQEVRLTSTARARYDWMSAASISMITVAIK